jgi:protein TonB
VFESYLKERNQPLTARALTLIVSIGLHLGAVALVLFLSLFYVEELPEPQVTVTFFSAAPPPPPPPPPPPKPKAPKPKPKVQPEQPKPRPEDVQPPEDLKPKAPEPEAPAPKVPDWAGSEGVAGGVEGGVPGGTGPTPKAKPKAEPKRPVFVKRQVMDKQKLAGEQPVYLRKAKRAGVQGVVIIKVCLKTNGRVDMGKTKILRGIPILDGEVLGKVKTWRYKPYKIDGVAQPVCFSVKFVFKLR